MRKNTQELWTAFRILRSYQCLFKLIFIYNFIHKRMVLHSENISVCWHLSDPCKLAFTHLNISNLHFGLFRASEIIFTPESLRSLILKSSSLRGESDDCRAEATVSQHWAVRSQPARLKERTRFYLYLFNFRDSWKGYSQRTIEKFR